MKELNEVDRENIAATVAKVKHLMPELVPMIKELLDAGLIDGWRDVRYVGPHRPNPRHSVSGVDLVLGSMAQVKERMGRNGSL